MRWIIAIIIIALLGAGAWFGRKYFQPAEKTPITALIPSNTEVLLVIENHHQLELIVNDTASGLGFVLTALGIQPEELTVVKNLTALNEAVLLCFGANEEITLLSNSDLTQNFAGAPNFNLSQQQGIYVLSSEAEMAEAITTKERENLEKAMESFIDAEAAHILFKPAALQKFVHAVSKEPFEKLLNSQLPQLSWCAIEGTGDAHHITFNGLGKTDRKEALDESPKNLLRYIPSKTGLTVFSKIEQHNYAICYSAYNSLTENADENVFVFVEDELHENFDNEYHGIPIKIEPIKIANQLWYLPNWAEEAYLAQIGNVSIYASNFQQLSKLIDDFLADEKLQNSGYFTQLSNNVSDVGFTIYICPGRMQQPNPFIDLDLSRDEPLNAFVFQSFNEIANQKYYGLTALHHSDIIDKAPILWKTLLDTNQLAGPWAFSNHYSKEPEVLVQDASFKLYLINRQGKILWKKQLEEEIIGNIIFIDGFSSGKYQILFNTKSKIHFIDRNGNYVEKYPLALLNETGCDPSPIQYKKGGDYRIFSGNGNKLMNFDANGDEVDGWKKPALDAPLAHPVLYYKEGSKDFLIAITEANSVYFLDRTGEKRSKTITLDSTMVFTAFKSSSKLKSCEFIGYDSVGNIYSVLGSGEKSTNNILPFGSNVGFQYFDALSSRFVTIKGDHLIGLDQDLNVSLDYLLPEEMQSSIQLLNASKEWIGLQSLNTDRTYVFDLEGKLLEKMPVDGTGNSLIMDLDLNGSQELITGKKNELLAYKLSN